MTKQLLLLTAITALVIHDSAVAQGLQNHATIVANGPVNIILNNTGFTNTGTFVPGSSTVIYSGANPTSGSLAGGSAATSFFHLTINKSSNDVQLNGNISIDGNLTLTSGNIQLNNNTLDLGAGAGTIVGESAVSYITGTTGGTVTKTAVMNAPVAANPGNIGVEITSSANLGNTIITRGHVKPASGINRYFTIAPANSTGLNASLRMHYLDEELAGLTESQLSIWQSADAGATWTETGAGSNDVAANWVQFDGIDNLARQFTLQNGRTYQTISPATATIIKTYGDPDFTLTASSTSGLPLTYAVADPSVVSLNGATVTVLHPGSTTITVSQAGNGSFRAATNVVYTVIVNKADQVISGAVTITRAYGDAPFALNATASSGLPVSYIASDPTIATISGKTVTILRTGVTDIIATQAGNTQYNAASNVKYQLIVTKANQVITFNVADKRVPAYKFIPLTATSNSNLPVSYKVVSGPALVSNNGFISDQASLVTIAAYQEGNNNYLPADTVFQTFEVIDGDQLQNLQIKVYPVPATDKLSIRSINIEIKSFYITDIAGRIIMKGDFDTPLSKDINVQKLPPGTYVLNCRTEFSEFKRKFIVVR